MQPTATELLAAPLQQHPAMEQAEDQTFNSPEEMQMEQQRPEFGMMQP